MHYSQTDMDFNLNAIFYWLSDNNLVEKKNNGKSLTTQ